MSRRIKINELDSLMRFYKLPKILLKHLKYRAELSHSEVITYGLLLDRVSLSEKNGWCNNAGEIFIHYTVEKIAEDINSSVRTVQRYLNSLEDIGLIDREKQGMGRPNNIYVKHPENKDLSEMMAEMEENYARYLEEQGIEIEEDDIHRSDTGGSSEVPPMADQTCHPRHTNYTDINETDKNETELESATQPSKKKEEKSVLATRGKKKEKPKSKLANKSDFVSSQQNKAKKTLDEVVGDVKSINRKKTPSMLFSHYVALFKQNFDRKAPVTTAKDKTLLKKLMNHYDYDTVMKMIDWMFEYWEHFKETKNIDGAPTVGLFYGFESYIRDEVEKVRKQSSSSTVW